MNNDHDVKQINRGEEILDQLRSKGALGGCNQCGESSFRYVGHSTDAVIVLTPNPLKLDELLPNTRSYKVHVVECARCSSLYTFIDSD
jgi:hypothetical protein